jgi:hypothetical protein
VCACGVCVCGVRKSGVCARSVVWGVLCMRVCARATGSVFFACLVSGKGSFDHFSALSSVDRGLPLPAFDAEENYLSFISEMRKNRRHRF